MESVSKILKWVWSRLRYWWPQLFFIPFFGSAGVLVGFAQQWSSMRNQPWFSGFDQWMRSLRTQGAGGHGYSLILLFVVFLFLVLIAALMFIVTLPVALVNGALFPCVLGMGLGLLFSYSWDGLRWRRGQAPDERCRRKAWMGRVAGPGLLWVLLVFFVQRFRAPTWKAVYVSSAGAITVTALITLVILAGRALWFRLRS